MADEREGSGGAVNGELNGGCLCGAVRYTLSEGFRMPPYACHCTDCQRRTGSAFSEHMLFAEGDLHITGELNEGHVTQPSGAHSRIFGCAICMSRIYAVNDQKAGFGSLRCGTLDTNCSFEPAAHVWVSSKQPWISIPPNVPVMEQQPRDVEGWMRFLSQRRP